MGDDVVVKPKPADPISGQPDGLENLCEGLHHLRYAIESGTRHLARRLNSMGRPRSWKRDKAAEILGTFMHDLADLVAEGDWAHERKWAFLYYLESLVELLGRNNGVISLITQSTINTVLARAYVMDTYIVEAKELVRSRVAILVARIVLQMDEDSASDLMDDLERIARKREGASVLIYVGAGKIQVARGVVPGPTERVA